MIQGTQSIQNQSPRVLVIGGHPRSGTTLLTRLCNSHPQMNVTFEFRSFRQINVPYETHVQALRKDWIRRRIVEITPGQTSRIAKIRSGLFLAQYWMSLQSFRNKVIDVDLVSRLLLKIFPKARVVGDKFPEYVFHLDSLTSQKGLSIVIIYRDCRDVVSSTLRRVRTGWKDKAFSVNIDTAEKAARSWLSAIEIMEKHCDKIHMIRYEDLIHDPKLVLKKFGDWLGVDANAFQHEMILPDRIGKYRKGLEARELDDILLVARPTMERLGYTV